MKFDKSIGYSLEVKKEKQEVIFSTNSKELFNDVCDYIDNCVDAIQWRRRVELIKRI